MLHYGRMAVGRCLFAIAFATCASPALAQPDDEGDLAVRAADVHADHCGAMSGADMQAAVAGFQAVAGVWGELDTALRGSSVPQPYLLYWRGLLAQCMGRDEEASSDLQGFLHAADFLGAVDEDRPGQLQGMVRDSRRRLRRMGVDVEGGILPITGPPAPEDAAAGTLDGDPVDEAIVDDTAVAAVPLQLRRRRTAGAALLISGGVAAGAGFALNAGIYHRYYVPETTDPATYDWARSMVSTGLVIGITGTALGVTGLVLMLVPHSDRTRVALLPGPVPTLSVRF
jgi:hypothetical protein